MKFRVLHGIHCGDENRVYRAGEVVETNTDLAKVFGTTKFERLSDDASTAPVRQSGGIPDDETLGLMTIPQLRTLATEFDIDLDDATKKSDIIATIQAYRD